MRSNRNKERPTGGNEDLIGERPDCQCGPLIGAALRRAPSTATSVILWQSLLLYKNLLQTPFSTGRRFAFAALISRCKRFLPTEIDRSIFAFAA